MATHGDFFITGNFITLEPKLAETAGAHMFEVKEMLVTAGWTVLASGDGGSGYSSTGDLIATDGDMNQDLAWVRVVSPDGANEYIFQMVVTGTNNRGRIAWNGGGGATFTTGGSAAQHPELSGGTEVVLVGIGGTAAAPSTAGTASWWGDTGATETGMRVMGAAETVAPYRFWACSNKPSSPYHKTGNIVLDHVSGSHAGDNGYVAATTYSGQGSWSLVVIESDISTQGSAWALSGGVAKRLVVIEQIIRNAEIPESPNGVSFMSASFWAQNDGQAGSIGLFGPSTMFNQIIDRVSGNLNQNTQISTSFGALSHVRAGDFALPWPSMTQFTHFQNPWDVINKTLFDVIPSVDPNAAPPTGGGSAESIAPVVQNLLPPDMSTLERYDEITFDAVDLDSEINKVMIWVDFDEETRTQLIYDGEAFMYPFADQSSIVELSNSTHRFILKPTGGWVYNVDKLTIKIVDIWGNFDGEDGAPGGGVGN